MATIVDFLIVQLNFYNEILSKLKNHEGHEITKGKIIETILKSIEGYNSIPDMEYKYIYFEEGNIVILSKI